MTLNSRQQGLALLWIFTASGFAGLVYESIWTHYLGLILGHSAYAQVLVLALFMGGMALGAWLISRRSESLRRPLAMYAAVELLLGIFGVGFHAYYQWISGWAYHSLFPELSAGSSLEVARWLVASVLILPQCILLGMTFPLMSAGFIRLHPDARGNILAGLYFSNSLGAATGALASTFVLLPAVGLPGTVLTAGVIGILVALAVWPLAKQEQPLPVAEAPKSTEAVERSTPAFILLMAAITGASSFVYEISWVRMLSMVLGSTIHAFEIMLAAFISGIAFGGLWLRRRADRLPSPRRAAGWAQIAMGCMALSTLFLYNQSFSWLAWVMETLNRNAESAYTLYNVASAAIAMAIMFPTAFFAGMTLPLLTLTLLKDGAGEAAIGKTYAANTLGAIAGVVLATFVGLPLLGLRLSLWYAAAADILIGVLLLAAAGGLSWASLRRLDWKPATGIAVSAVLLVVALLFSHFDPALMSSTVYRHGRIQPLADRKVQLHLDGRTASVTIKDLGKERTILTNGKPDASIGIEGKHRSPDELTMVATAVLPMVHHVQARTAAVIGFGSGMTTHFVLGNPAIESVDTIEIESAMVTAAQTFRPTVERAYTDPRSRVVIDDAKSYFAANRKRYDIIISEPSNPWVNGVASLFSEEFYRLVPQHLNERGIFAQWIQAYEITPALVNSIFKAMLPNFADIRIFVGGANDWILIATPKGRLPAIQDLRLPASWGPATLQEVAERGIERSEHLALMAVGDLALIRRYAAMYPGVPANSDFFPLVQLGAPKARFNNRLANELSLLRTQWLPVFETLTGVPPVPGATPITRYLSMQHPHILASGQAQEFVAALTGHPAPAGTRSTDYRDRLGVDALRAAGLGCRLDDLADDGLVMVSKLAGATIPFLPPDELRESWRGPNWIKCPPKDPLLRDVLALLAAAAARDHRATLAAGQAILDNHAERIMRNGKLRVVREYTLGTMQLAALAENDAARVLRLEEQAGKGLPQDFARKFVIHAAQLQSAEGAPSGRPGRGPRE